MFSADGESLYSVGKNKTITRYNLTTYEEESEAISSTNVLKKIRVSYNGAIMATVSDVAEYTIYVVNNTQFGSLQATQEIPTVIPSLALSPKATSLFYLTSTNNGVIEG